MGLRKLASLAGLWLLPQRYLGTTGSGSEPQSFKIPNYVFDGPTTAEFSTAGNKPLDGQKVLPYPNSTTWEWWYFDAVADGDPNKTTAIIFNEAIPSAFMGGRYDSPLSIAIIGTYEKDTIYNFSIPMSRDSFGSIDITNNGGDVSGNFGDSGCWFKGINNMNEYTVNIESPEDEITGTIKLSSVILPHVGWSNAVPEAWAEVDLTFGDGSSLVFNGTGYHDKNWGEIPFFNVVRSWYWGHARLGPYSIVWFDALSPPLTGSVNPVSGYVSKDGVPLHASCQIMASKVRPYGGDDRYPPETGWSLPDGYDIVFEFQDEGKTKEFVAQIAIDNIVTQVPVYTRFSGFIKGGVVGEEVFEGVGLGEQFAVSEGVAPPAVPGLQGRNLM